MSDVKTFILMSCMVVTGSLNTIFLSLQFAEKSLGLPYSHPWFQTQNMFLGEFYCLIVYYVLKLFKGNSNSDKQDPEEDNTNQPSVFLLAIPAACDFFASTLLGFALLNLATSVYQMLRGGLVLVTALLSVIFLGKKQYRHHILGLVIVFFSVFTLGLAGLLYKDTDKNSRTTNFLGIFMICLSLLFTGIQFIVEEKLLGQYHIDPLKVVGFEGMWGVIFYAFFLTIFQYIRCDNFFGKAELCSQNSLGEWRIEDTFFAFQQIWNNGLLLFLVVAATFTIASYNYFGVCVTKYASAAQRAVVDNLRTILIWMFFVLVPTSIKERFIWLQLVGFVGLVYGTLIYNEVIELPCCDFDKYTKNKLEAEARGNEEENNALNKKNEQTQYNTFADLHNNEHITIRNI